MHLFADELAAKSAIRDDVDLLLELPVVCELANEFLLSVPPVGFDADEVDDMLFLLLKNTSASLKIEVAERLAHVDHGPVRTIRLLANDGMRAVAVPVLRYSPLLSQDELASIVRMRSRRAISEPHLIAIASRFDLTARLTDILTGRGTPAVLDVLAQNKAAKFTFLGLCRLAMRSSKAAFADDAADHARAVAARRSI
jgi:uncharacterized protein (DUF2336 family)